MCKRQSRKVILNVINTLFLDTVAVKPTFALANIPSIFFQISLKKMNTKPPTKPFGIVACTFSDNLSWNSASCWTFNGQEKSLRHVATVAKFLDDNKLTTSLKKWSQTVLDFIDLIHFIWVGKMLTNFSGDFLELNRKWPFRKRYFCVVFTCSTKRAREIRKFHVHSTCNDG